MGGAPSVINRRPMMQTSNIELTSSLVANFSFAQHAASSHFQSQDHEPHHQHHKHHNHKPANGSLKPSSSDSRSPNRPPYKSWTTETPDGQVYVPTIDFSHSGLAEERSQYEITVKLFLLPNRSMTDRCAQTREATNLILKELHVPSIDLLIISYPGVSFDADDEDDDESDTDDAGALASDEAEDIESMITTWSCVEKLHDEGVIAKLGVCEFGSERLSRFLERTRIRPSVNQINVRDCCVVPKPMIMFAKEQGVELLTHNDCTNILPRGTTRELLGSGPKGAGVLAEGSIDAEQGEVDGLRGDVQPQWVTKYTAVVKDRGVIENKGYFAMAELQPT
ncbi:MAG: hypothetical protein M1828_007518 [Chrysothrix sp. TS-e1954]|nr:MAG: hypothetical protein M1828_007518 [Chrysothrix sp. TS-e1954]